MDAVNSIKQHVKWLLFPGLDLNTRCRYRFLPQFFRAGPIDTLDAGCGNGALSYAAYEQGNRVLGITYDAGEVQKARALFSEARVETERLQFAVCNLYDLPKLERQFDQIICSETLEHIQDDQCIVGYFYDMLRPEGVLHLCAPYALHPRHNLGRIGAPEDGRHVRDGYTLESYRSLLEPAGFKIVKSLGLGSPLLLMLDRPLRWIRNSVGDFAAVPFFIVTLPLQRLDSPDPELPYSLYVHAVKTR